MLRYLLPTLTRPFLPRLPCLSTEEYRDLLELCWHTVDAEEHRFVLLPFVLTFGSLWLIVLVWRRISGSRGFDKATFWVILGGLAVSTAVGMGSGMFVMARYMRPHLLAELRARGLCRGCGYDLRGEATVCPECGRRATWPDWK